MRQRKWFDSSVVAAVTRGFLPGTRAQRPVFSAAWYASRYGVSPTGAERDYLVSGWREGRSPHPLFDADWYQEAYGPLVCDHLSHYLKNDSNRPNRWLDPATLRAERGAGYDVCRFLDRLPIAFDDPRTFDSSTTPPMEIVLGDVPISRDCAACVIAHFDRDRWVDELLADAIRAYANSGYAVVVCSCSGIRSPAIKDILSSVAAILTVPNTGHDWGAYHAGLQFVMASAKPQSVTLTNDSVFVIPERLPAFLDKASVIRSDLVGHTDSLEFQDHLQSFFLRLNSRALKGRLVRDLLDTYRPVADRTYVIHAYELGFSRRAGELGLSAEAVYPYVPLAGSRAADDRPRTRAGQEVGRRAANPTRELWRELVDLGSPFVKRQVIGEGLASRGELERLLPAVFLESARSQLRRTSRRGD